MATVYSPPRSFSLSSCWSLPHCHVTLVAAQAHEDKRRVDEEYQLLVRLQPDMFVVDPDHGEDCTDGDRGASNGNGTGGDESSMGTDPGPGA